MYSKNFAADRTLSFTCGLSARTGQAMLEVPIGKQLVGVLKV
jgi:hypothetical protein